MFALTDHLLHIEGEPLPRDVDAKTARDLLASGIACRAEKASRTYRLWKKS